MKLRFPDPIELLIWVLVLAACSYLAIEVIKAWREAFS